jgi:hypothetical protein
VKLRFDAGTEPTLAGDELVPLTDGSHQDWLEHSVLAERVSQRGDLCWRKMTAGLIRIGVDLIDGNMKQFGGLE